MALIYDIMESYHMVDKTTRDDAYGGVKPGYQLGASFQAKVIKDSSTEATVAEKQTSTEYFTVVTKGVKLDYHDIFRRDSDKEYFIVTSRQKDSEAPKQSTVQLAKATCERWEVPNGVIVDEGSSGTT